MPDLNWPANIKALIVQCATGYKLQTKRNSSNSPAFNTVTAPVAIRILIIISSGRTAGNVTVKNHSV